MAYISRIVSQDEKMIGISRLHWIYLVEGFLWLVGLMGIGFFLDAAIGYAMGKALPGVQWSYFPIGLTWLEVFFLAAGLYIFAVYYIKVATTEIGLTTVRLIYKVGWIFVNVEEVNLEEIQAHHVNLGLLGRFLGYGQVSLDARFIGDVTLPFISYPYRFTKAMNEAQSKLESHMSLVIDGDSGKGMHITRRMPSANGNPRYQHQNEAEIGGKENPRLQKKQKPVPKPPTFVPDNHSPAEEVAEVIEEVLPGKVAEDSGLTRPHKAPHSVAEGSYEEEKLKEELSEEWTEHVEESEAEEETYRPARQLH